MARKGEGGAGSPPSQVPEVRFQTAAGEGEGWYWLETESTGGGTEGLEAVCKDSRVAGAGDEGQGTGQRDRGVRQAPRPRDRYSLRGTHHRVHLPEGIVSTHTRYRAHHRATELPAQREARAEEGSLLQRTTHTVPNAPSRGAAHRDSASSIERRVQLRKSSLLFLLARHEVTYSPSLSRISAPSRSTISVLPLPILPAIRSSSPSPSPSTLPSWAATTGASARPR